MLMLAFIGPGVLGLVTTDAATATIATATMIAITTTRSLRSLLTDFLLPILKNST